MKPFNRSVALRIAGVSFLLASVASPLAWMVSREHAEEGLVAFAMEESHRVVLHQGGLQPTVAGARERAETAARTLAGGLFEIAEIYGPEGTKLAEAMTPEGAALERELPSHAAPGYQASFYESRKLPGDRWVLRIFVPLQEGGGAVKGYFEGVRLVPPWQRAQIRWDAGTGALMVGLASLICGGALYPVVIRLAAQNEQRAREVLESHLSMMESLGRAIAKRDSDTGAHNYRVAWLSARLAEAAGLRGDEMQALISGSFLHDAGKIGIPDAILLKPGRLTPEEMDIMRTHVGMGEEIVAGADWLEGARQVVAGHHEKWDGSGYPQGLAGAAIPLVARIFAIADVFDALCSERPYKAAMAFDEAMRVLGEGAGSHFDPDLLRLFAAIARPLHATAMGASEAEARALMASVVARHFGV